MQIYVREIRPKNNSRYDEVWLIVNSAGFTCFICEGQFSGSEKQVQICVGIFKERCGGEDTI